MLPVGLAAPAHSPSAHKPPEAPALPSPTGTMDLSGGRGRGRADEVLLLELTPAPAHSSLMHSARPGHLHSSPGTYAR